ncbi:MULTISPECIES: YfiR family protein [unclassified Nitrospina]|uniref:YfiR family protein n=1 Tax=unclassified Nitrospina TaxID=2638683 RepID=UPI003F9B4176
MVRFRGKQGVGRRCGAVLLLAMAWLFLSSFLYPSRIIEGQVPEKFDQAKATALKVAYLRYIAEYTTWPSPKLGATGRPIKFCVLGHDIEGMARSIDRLIIESGSSIQGRPVHLEILSLGILPFFSTNTELAESVRSCHLLYVLPSEKNRWDGLKELISNLPIVTVSEIEGFSEQGGMIQFVLTPVADGTLRYTLHINLKHCQRTGLRLSAKFLNLKQAVRIVEFPD